MQTEQLPVAVQHNSTPWNVADGNAVFQSCQNRKWNNFDNDDVMGEKGNMRQTTPSEMDSENEQTTSGERRLRVGSLPMGVDAETGNSMNTWTRDEGIGSNMADTIPDVEIANENISPTVFSFGNMSKNRGDVDDCSRSPENVSDKRNKEFRRDSSPCSRPIGPTRSCFSIADILRPEFGSTGPTSPVASPTSLSPSSHVDDDVSSSPKQPAIDLIPSRQLRLNSSRGEQHHQGGLVIAAAQQFFQHHQNYPPIASYAVLYAAAVAAAAAAGSGNMAAMTSNRLPVGCHRQNVAHSVHRTEASTLVKKSTESKVSYCPTAILNPCRGPEIPNNHVTGPNLLRMFNNNNNNNNNDSAKTHGELKCVTNRLNYANGQRREDKSPTSPTPFRRDATRRQKQHPVDDVIQPQFPVVSGSSAELPVPSVSSSTSSSSSSSSTDQPSPVNRSSKSSSSSSLVPLPWPAWVYCTRYSDRPSSGMNMQKCGCCRDLGLEGA